MTAPPAPVPTPPKPPGIELQEIAAPDLTAYRDLFTRVGGPWLWFSRLMLSDDALGDILDDPKISLAYVMSEGQPCGILELDFRQKDACELAFFGLEKTLTGQGIGAWLMAQAIQRAWAEPIRRFHVHTCTLDSPHALVFYQRSGFKVTKQQIEIAEDPRVNGTLPTESAPSIPLIAR